jgi:predicted Zn-dependent peptidase
MKKLAYNASFRLLLYSLILAAQMPLFSQWKNPPKKTVLKNGLTAIIQQDEASSVTVLEILIKGGKSAEPAGYEGLSYLVTRLSLEIPDQSKVQDLMEKSSRYMMTSKADCSLIHIECLSENLESTLSVFMRILKDPLFSGLRIDRIKDFMNNQRKVESDDNVNAGHLALLRSFFKNTGYSGSIYGELESLDKIKRRDIEGFYETHFSADNMILVAISDFDNDKITKILEAAFGSFPSKKSAEVMSPVPAREIAPDQKEIFLEKDTKQALVSIGCNLPEISAKNYALASLVENLLGKGPGSRLWTLRAEEKLAYNVNARSTLMKNAGILEAYLETDVSKTDLAREALKKAVLRLYEKGIGEDELAETKVLVRANYLRSNETKDRRTTTLGFFEALGLGYDFFTKYLQELDAVTLDEVNSYIKTYLDLEKSVLVIVGPADS